MVREREQALRALLAETPSLALKALGGKDRKQSVSTLCSKQAALLVNRYFKAVRDVLVPFG